MVKSGDIVFYFRGNEPITFPKTTPMEAVATQIRDIIKDDSFFFGEVDLVDFGGVAEHFLGGRDDAPYVETPPLILRSFALIFSFLPSNQKFQQAEIMHTTATKAGFVGTIITTKKEGKRGKADFVSHLMPPGSDKIVTYYDDTACILDELQPFSESGLRRFWVQPSAESSFHDCGPVDTTVETLSIPAFLRIMLRET